MEESGGYLPLFETKVAKGRGVYWFYAISMFLGISFICIHRVKHFPEENGVGKWAWTGIFMAELWFIVYWFVTQFPRYRPISRYTFKDRLSLRYEDVLPGIDIFVSTADPQLEPPLMVVDTVLSVMAYDYPSEKINVYLSDDGCSDLMFYALSEASAFSRFWLPFCRNFNVEPRAPGVYFSAVKQAPAQDLSLAQEWRKIKVLIDGRDAKEVDIEGKPLPTLVYLAREKRPGYPHNFKAGAMNALIRVSSTISNSPVILNIDCDHYSSNSKSARDALCFFMDDKQSHNIAFVQYPQYFDHITKNDLYGSSMRVPIEVELRAVDANGGPMYIGSCCFHRRDALTGNKYEKKGSHINCYFYGFCQTILRYLGFAKLNFAITGKNADEDVSRRFEQEIMEFGAASSMFIILATIALFNLFTSISTAKSIMMKKAAIDLDSYALQIILNGALVIINLPLFEALFLRKDPGRMPASVTYQSLILAALVYLLTMY